MLKYTHALALRALHRTADLSQIPAHLCMPASTLYTAGERRFGRDGREYAPRNGSICVFDFECSQEGLPASLSSAIQKLKPHKEFLHRLSTQDVEFQFSVGFFFEDENPGEIFDWQLLSELGNLKISLLLDLYGRVLKEP